MQRCYPPQVWRAPPCPSPPGWESGRVVFADASPARCAYDARTATEVCDAVQRGGPSVAPARIGERWVSSMGRTGSAIICRNTAVATRMRGLTERTPGHESESVSLALRERVVVVFGTNVRRNSMVAIPDCTMWCRYAVSSASGSRRRKARSICRCSFARRSRKSACVTTRPVRYRKLRFQRLSIMRRKRLLPHLRNMRR
jgi:hypothetical protein